jgi:acetyl-CoA synthetase
MGNDASAASFRAARDLLLRHREDYGAARANFSWPTLDEFNWALDWFDVIAAEHPDRTALRVVGDDGSDEAVSYARMAARSSQVANWLHLLGVRRGNRVLLMLGNIVPLWEVMLAAMKLGAVVIPASTLLQPADLEDRIARGDVRHVVAEAAQVAKFAGISGEWTRVAVGGGADGWHSYTDSALAPEEFTPDGLTQAGDPLLLYFTSGTTSRPKLVGHTQASYPATCPRCTGSASSRATCTSTSPRPAGPSTPGPTSSPRGTRRPPSSYSTRPGSAPPACWRRSATAG